MAGRYGIPIWRTSPPAVCLSPTSSTPQRIEDGCSLFMYCTQCTQWKPYPLLHMYSYTPTPPTSLLNFLAFISWHTHRVIYVMIFWGPPSRPWEGQKRESTQPPLECIYEWHWRQKRTSFFPLFILCFTTAPIQCTCTVIEYCRIYFIAIHFHFYTFAIFSILFCGKPYIILCPLFHIPGPT